MKKLLLICLFPTLLCSCRHQGTVGQLDLHYNPASPELFAENIISTHLNERDLAISPEGNEIAFTLGAGKLPKRCLVSIKLNGKSYGKKEIMSFSGEFDDLEPFFSPDGNKLFFASNRPMDSDNSPGDYNIWFVERKASGWGNPMALPENINSGNDEFFPAVGRSGNLYFTSVRENGVGTEDIFISTFIDDGYSDPVPLDTAINSAVYEFNAYVSPDEDIIVFGSFGRKDDNGGGDLYYSSKDSSGIWSAARNMGTKVNSEKLDYCPFVDLTGKNFYFTSERVANSEGKTRNLKEIEELAGGILNGFGNIYRVGISELELK